ncbi:MULTISPECIES: hypothetical protein [Methylobacterium]|uniref:hypothetical protein n=1 Tax=Methylobacterium TaxID=407 RepID=UPI002F35922C
MRAELAKMTAQRDALQKTLTDEVLPQIAALAKMVGDQPVPRHLVGRAVTKGTEGSSVASDAPSAEAIRDHLAKMSPEARADFLIKVSHQNPQPLALARRCARVRRRRTVISQLGRQPESGCDRLHILPAPCRYSRGLIP